MSIHPQAIRQQAAEACVERFQNRVLKWGSVDCAQIVAHHLRGMGISAPLKGVKYRSEAGALKALRGLGYSGLAEALDAIPQLERFPPAFRIIGDIVAFKPAPDAESPWDVSLTVMNTPGKVFGIHSSGEAVSMACRVEGIEAVWRAWPCRR